MKPGSPTRSGMCSLTCHSMNSASAPGFIPFQIASAPFPRNAMSGRRTRSGLVQLLGPAHDVLADGEQFAALVEALDIGDALAGCLVDRFHRVVDRHRIAKEGRAQEADLVEAAADGKVVQ